MIDVLFTHSYFLAFDPKEKEAMMPYPPLGTLYAAAYARQHGYSVSLFDSMLASSEQEILTSIRRLRPRVLVIYDDDFNYLTKMCLTRMRDAAFAMSEIGKQEGCTVVVHGSDPVDHLEKYFHHRADVVICGEGEHTLLSVLDHVVRKKSLLADIQGIAFNEHGTIQRTPERKVERDLDQFPFPARDLIDWNRYRNAWTEKHGYFSTNMVTTRGCPFHCNWCAKPIYGQVYNSRSPLNVVQEMKSLKETLSPDHLWFCDDIFGLKPGWLEDFSREVIRHDASIPFKCLARVDLLLKDNAVEHLRSAGCTTVWVGAESGSQKILDAMEKGTTVAQIYDASAILRKAGIAVGFFLQFGYPGETMADIELTLRMVRECAPDEIGVSVSYPLPGTTFYERVHAEMQGKTNWENSEDLDMMFAGTFPADFYRVLHRVTHKKFRSWQAMNTLHNILRNPSSTDGRALRRVAAGLYHSVTLPLHQRRLASFVMKSSPPDHSPLHQQPTKWEPQP